MFAVKYALNLRCRQQLMSPRPYFCVDRSSEYTSAGFVRLPNFAAGDRHVAPWTLIKSTLMFFFHFRTRLGCRPIAFFMAFFVRISYEFLFFTLLTSIYMIEWFRKRKFRRLHLLADRISINFAFDRLTFYWFLYCLNLVNKSKYLHIDMVYTCDNGKNT